MNGSEQADFEKNNAMQIIADCLRELGYRAKLLDNIQLIQSATSGLIFSVSCDDNKAVQLSVLITNDFEYTQNDANEFNSAYRFGKVLLNNNDNDIYLRCDFFIVKDLYSDTFSTYLPLWDRIVGIFSSSVNTIRERNRAAQSAAAGTA